MESKQVINFKTKLNVSRPYDKKSKVIDGPMRIEYALESDRGRIINSASVRRLQQKTQVFPLERNAAVRSRLTHSMEVQQNGRYIIKTIFAKLAEFDTNRIEVLGLTDLQPAIESLVEMACLMHDIGNPPFGHFGEVAISEWFEKHLSEFNSFKATTNQELSAQMIQDLRQFEGNAQAIRLTFSLQQMNLTYAQSASILKYTRAAYDPRPNTEDPLSYLQKKPGYYLSEQGFVEDMLKILGMQSGHRHPFSYVMEAADDIAYCLADLEDAVEKGILGLDELTRLLKQTFVEHSGDLNAADILSFRRKYNSFAKVLSLANKAASQQNTINHNHAYFVKLRINLIHHLIDHASHRFIDNIDSVYEGDLNQALLEDGSVANKIVQTFKQVGYRHVFNHQEVQDLELQGHRIISGLLDIYHRLLQLSQTQFNRLSSGNSQGMSYEALLLNRVDSKIIKAYRQSIGQNSSDSELWEFYYRCRLIQDHISAMTDHSALDEFKLLTVSN